MSAFKDALKQLGVPICTGCGEMVLIEAQCDSPCGKLSRWLCAVCGRPFIVPKVAKP